VGLAEWSLLVVSSLVVCVWLLWRYCFYRYTWYYWVMNVCRVCGVELWVPARGRRPQFCGGRCRVAAYREAKRVAEFVARFDDPAAKTFEVLRVPDELRSVARWVRHEGKRPMSSGGWFCSVTDPSHWGTFDDAIRSPYGDGVGFVLNGDGIVCIDLDDCVTDGVVSVEAVRFVDALGVTFSEFSPSGNGLHVWGYGFMEKGRRFTQGGLKVEAYPAGRFITVTGNPYRFAGFGVIDLEAALKMVA
jgi:hypothetical protein